MILNISVSVRSVNGMIGIVSTVLRQLSRYCYISCIMLGSVAMVGFMIMEFKPWPQSGRSVYGSCLISFLNQD